MRRSPTRLASATAVLFATAVLTAGPALAADPPPPPSTTGEHDCRMPAVCWPGQHRGWDQFPGRNLGG